MVSETKLPGVLLFKTKRFGDDRGYFREIWRENNYRDAGLGELVQDNYSFSKRHILRGMHFQHPQGQAKLIVALRGQIYDVAVDIRLGSPSFGKWTGEILSEENGHQLFIPDGFAHGFVVLSDDAVVLYKCSNYYQPQYERSLAWNDPELGIDWPVKNPVLSTKDKDAVRLSQAPREWLPPYSPRNHKTRGPN